MKITLTILLLCSGALALQAQNPPQLVDMSNNIPIAGTNVTLSDVQTIGNTVWINCSSSSVVLRSTDGGSTFASPTTASATQAIFMLDATNGWAVGHAKGNKTTDGGQCWITPNTTIGGTLYDVYFPSSSVGYAVGNSGAVYKTENGGTSWTLKTQPLNASVLSVTFPSSSDPNTGYVALSNAITTIYKTTDGGISWNYMTLPGITSSMNCLEFIDANTGWAAGGAGEIFSFKNGTWTKQTTAVTVSLNGISFAPDGLNGWAVGNYGVILHTTNGGSTWTQEGIGFTTQNLTKVDVVTSTEAYIVGYGKTFIKYTAEGQENPAQWSNISAKLGNVTATSNLVDVHFIDNNNGLISSGNRAEVYVTTDGGNSFTIQAVPDGTYLNSIFMLSTTEFYGGAQNNRIYRTTTGGADWSSLGFTGTPVRSITFPAGSATGYSCGDIGNSYQITSAGITNLPTGLYGNLRSVSFPSATEGWLCGGVIIRHFNNGVWNADQTYSTNGYNGISFVNNTNGWAVGDNGIIIHTTDGKNWSTQTNPDTQSPQRTLQDVFFLNASEGWAVGNGGVILHTTNGGIDWAIVGDGLTTSLLNSVYFTSSTNGYVAGNSRTLLKFSSDGTNSVINPDIANADDFQIYPNPTTGKFTLKIPTGQRLLSLTIFNNLGETVRTFDVSGLESNYSFDLTHLPNSTYFLRCLTNKGQVCKLIIKQ